MRRLIAATLLALLALNPVPALAHEGRSAILTPGPRLGPARRASSTAYCLTGRMASGKRTYAGAVAMNGVPLGSRWRVRETGRTYVVEDRIGHGSQFDIAMPGRCRDARRYGRRTITIQRVR